MISTAETKKITAEFGKEFGSSEHDTGCVAVQVAIITTRIANLSGHFKANIHDYSGNRGLLKLIGQRKRLLAYVARTDADKYQGIIKKLGLRK